MSNLSKLFKIRKIFLLSGFFIIFGIFFSDSELALGQSFEEYGVTVETVADNLKVPWEIAFAPDGRIFFTERGGELRVIENGLVRQEPVSFFDVGKGEGGMLGLALDPDFEENHFVYLYYTYSELLSTFNRVVRFTELDNTLIEEKILIDKIPGASYHDGGRLKFGPDEKLYITTGDSGNAKLAQDVDSLAGKILRINPDGTIPEDNPFANSPVFSLGHRNPQGLDWDPVSGNLVATEHGPSGEKGFAHDEINVIKAGQNYGWPEVVGGEHDPKFIDPILHTGDDTWAPSGATFYNSEKIVDWTNKFFVATLRGGHLRMIDFDIENNTVISSEPLFLNEFGRLRDVTVGPDGNLYVLTSNRDGRGTPVENDDRILKIIPIIEEKKVGDYSKSPRMQQKEGVMPNEISCKPGLELILKSTDGSPACVKPVTLSKLLIRGWGVEAN